MNILMQMLWWVYICIHFCFSFTQEQVCCVIGYTYIQPQQVMLIGSQYTSRHSHLHCMRVPVDPNYQPMLRIAKFSFPIQSLQQVCFIGFNLFFLISNNVENLYIYILAIRWLFLCSACLRILFKIGCLSSCPYCFIEVFIYSVLNTLSDVYCKYLL